MARKEPVKTGYSVRVWRAGDHGMWGWEVLKRGQSVARGAELGKADASRRGTSWARNQYALDLQLAEEARRDSPETFEVWTA